MFPVISYEDVLSPLSSPMVLFFSITTLLLDEMLLSRQRFLLGFKRSNSRSSASSFSLFEAFFHSLHVKKHQLGLVLYHAPTTAASLSLFLHSPIITYIP